jgi:hypothetical protein
MISPSSCWVRCLASRAFFNSSPIVNASKSLSRLSRRSVPLTPYTLFLMSAQELTPFLLFFSFIVSLHQKSTHPPDMRAKLNSCLVKHFSRSYVLQVILRHSLQCLYRFENHEFRFLHLYRLLLQEILKIGYVSDDSPGFLLLLCCQK